MKISHIPRGFTSITPYFLVKDADKFVSFLDAAFAAEVVDNHREDGVLVHGAYRIYGSMIEASEGRDEFSARVMSMHLYVPDCDAVYQKALDAGGKSIHEVMDMPYGERSGAVEDPCGNHWFIATQKVDMYPEN